MAELLQDMVNWIEWYAGVSIALLFVAHRLISSAMRRVGSSEPETSRATVR